MCLCGTDCKECENCTCEIENEIEFDNSEIYGDIVHVEDFNKKFLW